MFPDLMIVLRYQTHFLKTVHTLEDVEKLLDHHWKQLMSSLCSAGAQLAQGAASENPLLMAVGVFRGFVAVTKYQKTKEAMEPLRARAIVYEHERVFHSNLALAMMRFMQGLHLDASKALVKAQAQLKETALTGDYGHYLAVAHGMVAFFKGDYEASSDLLSNLPGLYQVNYQDCESLSWLAKAYEKQGRVAEAKSHYEILIDRIPDALDIRFRLALLRQKPAEALAVFQNYYTLFHYHQGVLKVLVEYFGEDENLLSGVMSVALLQQWDWLDLYHQYLTLLLAQGQAVQAQTVMRTLFSFNKPERALTLSEGATSEQIAVFEFIDGLLARLENASDCRAALRNYELKTEETGEEFSYVSAEKGLFSFCMPFLKAYTPLWIAILFQETIGCLPQSTMQQRKKAILFLAEYFECVPDLDIRIRSLFFPAFEGTVEEKPHSECETSLITFDGIVQGLLEQLRSHYAGHTQWQTVDLANGVLPEIKKTLTQWSQLGGGSAPIQAYRALDLSRQESLYYKLSVQLSPYLNDTQAKRSLVLETEAKQRIDFWVQAKDSCLYNCKQDADWQALAHRALFKEASSRTEAAPWVHALVKTVAAYAQAQFAERLQVLLQRAEILLLTLMRTRIAGHPNPLLIDPTNLEEWLRLELKQAMAPQEWSTLENDVGASGIQSVLKSFAEGEGLHLLEAQYTQQLIILSEELPLIISVQYEGMDARIFFAAQENEATLRAFFIEQLRLRLTYLRDHLAHPEAWEALLTRPHHRGSAEALVQTQWSTLVAVYEAEASRQKARVIPQLQLTFTGEVQRLLQGNFSDTNQVESAVRKGLRSLEGPLREYPSAMRVALLHDVVKQSPPGRLLTFAESALQGYLADQEAKLSLL